MTNYTPGPWSVCADTYGRVQHSRKYDCIARTEPDGPLVTIAQRVTNPANARLIAASPALLEALESAAAALEATRDAGTENFRKIARLGAEQARAAIAQARGEEK